MHEAQWPCKARTTTSRDIQWGFRMPILVNSFYRGIRPSADRLLQRCLRIDRTGEFPYQGIHIKARLWIVMHSYNLLEFGVNPWAG